jgi:hypothetical protein
MWLGNKEIPLLGTYFAGNNWNRGLDNIVEDMSHLLMSEPGSQG